MEIAVSRLQVQRFCCEAEDQREKNPISSTDDPWRESQKLRVSSDTLCSSSPVDWARLKQDERNLGQITCSELHHKFQTSLCNAEDNDRETDSYFFLNPATQPYLKLTSFSSYSMPWGGSGANRVFTKTPGIPELSTGSAIYNYRWT